MYTLWHLANVQADDPRIQQSNCVLVMSVSVNLIFHVTKLQNIMYVLYARTDIRGGYGSGGIESRHNRVFLILGAVTELLTVITSFVISVHSSAWNNSSPIFMIFHTGDFYENLLRHVNRVEFGYILSKGPNKLCLDEGYHSKRGV